LLVVRPESLELGHGREQQQAPAARTLVPERSKLVMHVFSDIARASTRQPASLKLLLNVVSSFLDALQKLQRQVRVMRFSKIKCSGRLGHFVTSKCGCCGWRLDLSGYFAACDYPLGVIRGMMSRREV
jgi:hypothetical protein